MKRIFLALAALVSAVSLHAQTPGASEPRAVVETVYAAFAQGDMDRFVALMAPDVVWNEAEGNPYADMNPYIGPEAVMSGLFGRLVRDWEDFSATPHEFVVEGDRVVVFGRYKETWKATGKTIDIPFVHSWTVEDGKLVAFQQYTDTAALAVTMAGPAAAAGRANAPGQVYEQVALVPADGSLVRPEDGVALDDGTLLIADQVHGLVALSPDGTKRPFGDFAPAGYVHEPPADSAGPNGVAMEPAKVRPGRALGRRSAACRRPAQRRLRVEPASRRRAPGQPARRPAPAHSRDPRRLPVLPSLPPTRRCRCTAGTRPACRLPPSTNGRTEYRWSCRWPSRSPCSGRKPRRDRLRRRTRAASR